MSAVADKVTSANYSYDSIEIKTTRKTIIFFVKRGRLHIELRSLS